MNWQETYRIRKTIYLTLVYLRGQPLGHYYNHFLQEYHAGIPPNTTREQLIKLFSHAKDNVPYYSRIMQEMGDAYLTDPFHYLQEFPVLTKKIIRNQFDNLKSLDLEHRKWFYNTSGGSTGEPALLIQDYPYQTKSGAIKLVFSRLIGRDIGQSEVFLWGSERDILHGSEKWQTRLVNYLTNSKFVNAFRMTPHLMHEFVYILNNSRPQLITAYAEALYEIAKFIERNQIDVIPQKNIITSAGTLYPFIREKLSQVFKCNVYNRYGSREVGDIACELPGQNGLWVAPWGNYLEIVDNNLKRVPDGNDGEILVTSFSNFAMPLIRYRIGDCGALDPQRGEQPQVLKHLRGKVNGIFKLPDGTLLDPGYFEFQLYFKNWIERYQIIQKSFSSILFKFVSLDKDHHKQDLDEITVLTKKLMGEDCEVTFQFVDEIPTSPSGKYQYHICEI